ncbi:FAD-linked oxidase C-terminal domain-containing protein, partial [Guyparkeria sp. 1SP6A2]|nr:FAD-linked oxidase C-terminal domain-containing protein [Guyparkeria sp. 1SP6A2]
DDSPFYAIIETLGVDEAQDAERFSQVLQRALEAELITDAVLASSHAQRSQIWAIREDIEVLVRELKPMFSYDVSLPIPHMNAYVEELERRLHSP